MSGPFGKRTDASALVALDALTQRLAVSWPEVADRLSYDGAAENLFVPQPGTDGTDGLSVYPADEGASLEAMAFFTRDGAYFGEVVGQVPKDLDQAERWLRELLRALPGREPTGEPLQLDDFEEFFIEPLDGAAIASAASSPLLDYNRGEPSADETDQEAHDWVEEQVDREYQRVIAQEELLEAPVVTADSGGRLAEARAALDAWLASWPAALTPADYEGWSSISTSRGVGPSLDAQGLGAVFGSWDGAIADALQRADEEADARADPWWQREDDRCEADSRFWKTFLLSMEDAFGTVPDFPVPDLPRIPCGLQRHHPGAHAGYLGEDSTYERWFAVWEDGQLLAEHQYVAGEPCAKADRSPLIYRPPKVSTCTLLTGHPGPCRFEGHLEPLVTTGDDIISEEDWIRMVWHRRRASGAEPTAVGAHRWWSPAESAATWDPAAHDDFPPLTATDVERLKALAIRLRDVNAVLELAPDLDPVDSGISIALNDTSEVRIWITDGDFDIGLNYTLSDGDGLSETAGLTSDLSEAERTAREALTALPGIIADLEADI